VTMKIIMVGQGPFGQKALETLIKKGEDIVGVFCPKDKRGEAMAATAEDSGVALFRPNKMIDAEVQAAYHELRPDLVILAFVTDIITETLLDIPPLGTICYHPSLLPRHRGASGINWAVIQGDIRTGLTILWVDKGIDTGPILLQKEIDIGPEDTTGSLYFNRLFPLGIEAIAEAVDLIRSGKAPKIPQDDSLATYEPPCDDAVAAIDWSKPASDVYNLVRGCDPQPGAYLIFKDDKVRLYKARLLASKQDKRPGEILDIGKGEIMVALNGGALGIGKVRDSSGQKMGADEFAKKMDLQVGMRFGS
ncbi:MAG: methionyl-tRNA formyltransferase, partial [Desulfobacterales bacterium]